MADTPKESLWERLVRLLGRTPRPDNPAPKPAETHYLRALVLLRQIDFKRLAPVVFTVPTVLFFAISGVIAWLGLFVGFFIRIVKAALWRRHD